MPGVAQYIQSDVFITVKDHKESVPGRIDCRLINPAKSNIGRISKQIISEAVLSIKTKQDQTNGLTLVKLSTG